MVRCPANLAFAVPPGAPNPFPAFVPDETWSRPDIEPPAVDGAARALDEGADTRTFHENGRLAQEFRAALVLLHERSLGASHAASEWNWTTERVSAWAWRHTPWPHDVLVTVEELAEDSLDGLFAKARATAAAGRRALVLVATDRDWRAIRGLGGTNPLYIPPGGVAWGDSGGVVWGEYEVGDSGGVAWGEECGDSSGGESGRLDGVGSVDRRAAFRREAASCRRDWWIEASSRAAASCRLDERPFQPPQPLQPPPSFLKVTAAVKQCAGGTLTEELALAELALVAAVRLALHAMRASAADRSASSSAAALSLCWLRIQKPACPPTDGGVWLPCSPQRYGPSPP